MPMQTSSEPMDTSNQFCPNEACSARGKIGAGNITIYDRKWQRYRCKICKQTFMLTKRQSFRPRVRPLVRLRKGGLCFTAS